VTAVGEHVREAQAVWHGVESPRPAAEAPEITVSVVVPVFNSERSLPLLCERLARVLPTIAAQYEMVLVNDASRDASWSVVERLAREYPWVRGMDLMRNYGQHNALLCGIRAARYDIVVTLDDDLQHPPEEIPVLLHKLAQGYDVVYGAPEHQQHGVLRNLASRATKVVLQGAMGAETATKVSAWRAFRRDVARGFDSYQNTFVSIDVLLTWATTRFSWVTVRHDPRLIGRSNYTVGKLVRHALNMMTGFSTLPLQMASFVGFFFTLFGIGVLAYVVTRYFALGGSIPGFPFLASVIAIFSGAQLFALGIIGEYLARMHTRSMDRPTFVVRQAVGESVESLAALHTSR
jgi:undecaprenyl-phosphate 4-deoxy-4-formamido-L-arabinose transferase